MSSPVKSQVCVIKSSQSNVDFPSQISQSNLLFLRGSGFINTIDPSLIDVNNKNDVVPEYRNAVHGGHFDDEGEKVVDEGVDELVHEVSPR